MSHFPGLKIDTNNFRIATNWDTYVSFTAHRYIIYHSSVWAASLIELWEAHFQNKQTLNVESARKKENRLCAKVRSKSQRHLLLIWLSFFGFFFIFIIIVFFTDVCFVESSSYCQWVLVQQYRSDGYHKNSNQWTQKSSDKNNLCKRNNLQTSCNFMYISTTDCNKVP